MTIEVFFLLGKLNVQMVKSAQEGATIINGLEHKMFFEIAFLKRILEWHFHTL